MFFVFDGKILMFSVGLIFGFGLSVLIVVVGSFAFWEELVIELDLSMLLCLA